MPVPAPSSGGGEAPAAPGYLITRHYEDPLGRPMTGRVTIRQADAPYLSVGVVLDGAGNFRVRMTTPGKYSLGAMLRDVDGGRYYIAEDVQAGQENS